MWKKTKLNVLEIRPMFNRILTTAMRYETGDNDTRGALKEYQQVVAVGESVKTLGKNDIVYINPTRYLRTQHNPDSLKNGIIGDNLSRQYCIPTIMLNGVEHLLLYDADVEYVITKFEEVEEDTSVILPGDQGIIL